METFRILQTEYWADWKYPHSGFEWMANEWVQTLFYIVPIVVLVGISLWGMKSYKTLPIAAALMYFIRLTFFDADPNVAHWCLVNGVFGAFQPTVIVFGAILMFATMEETGCMQWIIYHIKNISGGNPVVEFMLVPFAFGYIIEGAAGFGTPAALCAPTMKQLGHPEIISIIIALCMNSCCVCLGAVGTTVWFGMSLVQGAGDAMYIVVANKATLVMFLSSMIVIPFVLVIALPWRYVLKNAVFIVLSTASATGTAYLFSFGGYSGSTIYEFGSLIGGVVGFFVTVMLATYGVGLSHFDPETHYPLKLADQKSREVEEAGGGIELQDVAVEEGSGSEGGHPMNSGKLDSPPDSPDKKVGDDEEEEEDGSMSEKSKDKMDGSMAAKGTVEKRGGPLTDEQLAFSFKGLLVYTFPFYLTILILILTRIKGFKIKDALQSKTPTATIPLNAFGNFKFSPSLVFQIVDTFGVAGGTTFQTLYIPFVLPFLLTSFLTQMIHWDKLPGRQWQVMGAIYKSTFKRCIIPYVALVGATAFSLLLRTKSSDEFAAPTTVIGATIAGGLSYGWIPLAPLLGVLGAFFSGSATVSNLTFADIQRVAAETLNESRTSMLALQLLGSAFGNMTCIFNILSVKTILGNNLPEGFFLKKTAPIAIMFWVVSTSLGGLLYFATGWGDGINFSSKVPVV